MNGIGELVGKILWKISGPGSFTKYQTNWPIDFSERNKEEVNTLFSLKKIDDHPFYVMRYDGDYGLDAYLKKGTGILKDRWSAKWSCNCFAVKNSDNKCMMGRNFDFVKGPLLLLYTSPPGRNASVSMVNINLLGYSLKENLEGESTERKRNLLFAPYIPFDGMNEYGVTIGEMTVFGVKSLISSEKVTITSLELIRIVLDYAKTVKEAVELIKRYNIYFPFRQTLHYLIADPSGDSVIIEFIDGQMQVVPRNNESFQIATNTLAYGNDEVFKKKFDQYRYTGKIHNDQMGKSYYRYAVAREFLEKYSLGMNSNDAMQLLKKMADVYEHMLLSPCPNQWSIVYDMHSGEIQIAVGRKYNQIKNFKLKLKDNE